MQQGSTSPIETFTVSNDGAQTLTLGTITVPAGFILVKPFGASVLPGDSDTFIVELNTALAGSFVGNVSFSNNSGNLNQTPFLFEIKGESLAPPAIAVFGGGLAIANGDKAPQASDGTDFGIGTVDLSGPSETFTVENVGGEPLTIGSISLPAGFTLVKAPSASLAGGASDTLIIQLNTNVQWTSDLPDAFTGNVIIPSNDADGNNPFDFCIVGDVCTPPKIAVLGSAAGNVAIGNDDATTKTSDGTDFGGGIQNLAGPMRSYVIYNGGGETLNISGIVLPAGFTIVQGVASVPANSSSDLVVQLDTDALGTFSGDVSLANNGSDVGDNPFQFDITGTVLTPTVVTSVSAPLMALPGQSSTYTADFTGGGTHVATWNWGDGTSSRGVVAEANGAGTATANHVYAGGKTYTVTVTLTEQSSEFVASASHSMPALKASGASVMADPLNPAKTALYVCGGSGNDTILFGQGAKGKVQVAVDGHIIGSYAPTGHLIAYGLGGNNMIIVSSKISLPAWIFGGGVNDTLVGGGGMNLLIGGTGKNSITGGAGKNMVCPASSPLATNFQTLYTTMAKWEAGGAKSAAETARQQTVVSSSSQFSAASQVSTQASAASVGSGAADAVFAGGDVATPRTPPASVANSALDAAFAKPSAALPSPLAESSPKISLVTPA